MAAGLRRCPGRRGRFGAEEVRHRRHRHRDQDRQHHARTAGPASAYGTIGKADRRLLREGQRQGGINGRKIKFISLDDGYSPAKTVELARKLVEQDEVLLLFNTLGTPPNTRDPQVHEPKKVPQLFVATGATKWGDPKNFPWTMGWQPDYHTEGRDLRQAHAGRPSRTPRSAMLYQNDDYGKDYLKGFKDGLGDKAKTMIVSKLTYEVTDPTIDSQIVDAEGLGRRRVLQHHHAQVRRAGDPQGGRDRLEAGALPEQRVGVGGLGAQAGRPGERRSASSPPTT